MENTMLNDIKEVLYSEAYIDSMVKRVGAEISHDYADKNLLLVSVLKGSVVFMADLMRAITIPARIDFMCVSSYGSGTKTSGVVKIIKDLDINLKGYDIVIVEDILDSGKTLHYLVNLLKSREPNSIEICFYLRIHFVSNLISGRSELEQQQQKNHSQSFDLPRHSDFARRAAFASV